MFFSLTFAFTWVAWLAAAAIVAHGLPESSAHPGLRGALFLPGTFGPALVALAITAWTEGRAELAALLGRIVKWQVEARLYVFAIAYMVGIKLAVALVHRIALGAWPRFGETQWLLMAVAILTSMWFQAGEEIGWRGYALPRLTARFGLARASVVLGVIWALWHLPLFFIPVGDTFGQSFPMFLLEVTALSVALAWLYWKSGGSLLLVMMMHAAINNTKDIVPSVTTGATNPFSLQASTVAWLTVLMLWVGAAYLLVRMRGVRSVAEVDGALRVAES